MNKTLTSIIASVMLAGCTTPALETPTLKFPEFKQEDLVGTIPYNPVVHGIRQMWGHFELFDLNRGDNNDWDWSMYFIQCSYTINPPKSPFLIFNRLEGEDGELHKFNVYTGEYEGIIPGFRAPLHYVQPKCPYDIKVDDIKIKLEL